MEHILNTLIHIVERNAISLKGKMHSLRRVIMRCISSHRDLYSSANHSPTKTTLHGHVRACIGFCFILFFLMIQNTTHAQEALDKSGPPSFPNTQSQRQVEKFLDENIPDPKAKPFEDPFTPIGRWAWGTCRAVALTGHYALVGQGYAYQVFDISDPASPQIVYDTTMEQPVTDIKIVDSLLFVLCPKSMFICSAKSLFPLVPLGRYDVVGISAQMQQMAFSGSSVYILSNYWGLLCVDISDIANPVRFASYLQGTFPFDIAMKGEIIYYAPDLPLVSIILLQAVRDSNYWREQYIDLGNTVTAVHIRDTLLFAGGYYGEVWIFDISDSWNIKLLDSLNVGSKVNSITDSGDNIYCATWDSGVAVINIADIMNPHKTMRTEKYYYLLRTATSGNIMFAWGLKGFDIFDISKKDSIEYVTYFPTGGVISGVAVKGTIALVAAGSAGQWTIDISDAEHPKPVMNLPTYNSTREVAITGNIACFLDQDIYAMARDSVFIMQFTGDGLMTRLSAIDVDPQSTCIAAQDSIVAVGTYNSVNIISIGDTYHPRLLSTLPFEQYGNLVSISGKYMTVVTMEVNPGISILDISDPSAPQPVTFVPGGAYGALLDDTLMFAAIDSIRIFNVANISLPYSIGSTPLTCSSGGLRFVRMKDFIYSAGATCLGVIRISDLRNPVQEGPIFQGYDVRGVDAKNDTFFVATGGTGLWIGKNNLVTSVSNSKPQNTPSEIALLDNYPNPFNPSTSIQYRLSSAQKVTLKIFDVLGREAATLVNEVKQAGTYTVTWNAKGFPSGVYFCRLTTEHQTFVRKIVLMR
jgi:hypothetical protein